MIKYCFYSFTDMMHRETSTKEAQTKIYQPSSVNNLNGVNKKSSPDNSLQDKERCNNSSGIVVLSKGSTN